MSRVGDCFVHVLPELDWPVAGCARADGGNQATFHFVSSLYNLIRLARTRALGACRHQSAARRPLLFVTGQ